MPTKRSSTAPAADASETKPSASVKRNRESASFTPRPDLWEWAVPFFKKTRYRSVTRFLDAKMLQHARLKKKLSRKLEIPLPNLEADV